MASIDQFITQTLNNVPTITNSFTRGFERTNIDMLLQQARRAKTINGNYMFDFLQLENDPHYSKKSPVNKAKLDKLISQLSASTHLTTSFTSLMTLLGITDFVPANVKTILYNYKSLTDTGLNFLSNLQDDTFFKQTGLNLVSDLFGNYKVGNVSFNQLAAMASQTLIQMPTKDSIKNNGIRSLLSIPFLSLLPNDMTAIFSDLQWLDNLQYIFGDVAKTTLFNNSVKSKVQTLQTTRLNTIPLTEDYNEQYITLADPLGIGIAEQFENDVNNYYQNEIITIVNESLEENDLVITPEQQEEIVIALQEDAAENVTEAFAGNLGLPSIAVVAQGVNIETYNTTLKYINAAFETVTVEIFKDVGIKPAPAGMKSFDYIQNLKRNLDARAKMKLTSAPSDQFVEIDTFLKTVVLDGDLTESVIEALHEHLETLIKD